MALSRWLRTKEKPRSTSTPATTNNTNMPPSSSPWQLAVPLVGDNSSNPKSMTYTFQTMSSAIPGQQTTEGGTGSKVMNVQGFSPQRGIILREVEEEVVQTVVSKHQPTPPVTRPAVTHVLPKPHEKALADSTQDWVAKLMALSDAEEQHTSVLPGNGGAPTSLSSLDEPTFQRTVTIRRSGVFATRSYLRGEEVCVVGGIVKSLPISPEAYEGGCITPSSAGKELPERSYSAIPGRSYYYYNLPSQFPNPRFEWKLPHLQSNGLPEAFKDTRVFGGDSQDFLRHGLRLIVTPTNESQYLLLSGTEGVSNLRLKLCWESSGCAYVGLFATRDIPCGAELVGSYTDVTLHKV